MGRSWMEPVPIETLLLGLGRCDLDGDLDGDHDGDLDGDRQRRPHHVHIRREKVWLFPTYVNKDATRETVRRRPREEGTSVMACP